MSENLQNLNDLLNTPQGEQLLKNKQAVESLLQSEEARKLMELLNRNSGQGLKHAAQSALQGDSSQLMELVNGLMKDEQGAKLMESLHKKAGR